MTLEQLLELYDNWNGRIRVNDDNLNTLWEGDTQIIGFNENNDELLASLNQKEVVAFGFWDNVFCVRVL